MSTNLEIILPNPNPPPKREKWNQLEYYLINLGTSIGIGGVWRFSYLMFENGGGAFIIPFVLMSLLLSQPFITLLVTIGQSDLKGIVSVYSFDPEKNSKKYHGLAYSKILYSCVVCTFYIYLLAYNVMFMVNSLFGNLHWLNLPPVPMLEAIRIYFEDQILNSNHPKGKILK
jgi:SNF family Na+-dependent transporter